MIDGHAHDSVTSGARSSMVSTRRHRAFTLQPPLPSAITPDFDRRCLTRKFRDQTHQTWRLMDQVEAERQFEIWWNLLQSIPLEALHEAVIIHPDVGSIVSELLIRQFVSFGENEHECTKLVLSYAPFVHDLDLIFRLSCRLRFRHILTRLHAIRDRHRPPSIEHAVLDSHLDLGRSRAVLATIAASGSDPMLFTRYCWRIWSDSWSQLCQVAATEMYPAIPPWIIRDCLGLLPDSSAKQTPDSIIIFLHYLHDILHRHPSSRQDVDVTEPAIEISLCVLGQYGDRSITANWAASICDEILWQPKLFYFNPYSVLERCRECKSHPGALLALFAFNRDMATSKAALDLALSSNRIDWLARLVQAQSWSSKEWLYLLDRAPSSGADELSISLSAVVNLLVETVGSVPSIRLLLQSAHALQFLPVSYWFEQFKLSSGPEDLNRINCDTMMLMAEHGGPAASGDLSLNIVLKSRECRLCWQELRPEDERGVDVDVFQCGHGFHSQCKASYPTCPACLYERILCRTKPIVPACNWNPEHDFLTGLQTATTL